MKKCEVIQGYNSMYFFLTPFGYSLGIRQTKICVGHWLIPFLSRKKLLYYYFTPFIMKIIFKNIMVFNIRLNVCCVV